MSARSMEKWELTPDKFLNPTEVSRLLKKADELWLLGEAKKSKALMRDSFLIQAAIYTGLRCSELCCLMVSDVNAGNGEAHIVVRPEGAKGSRQRVVHIGKEFKATLKRFLQWKLEQGEAGVDEYVLRTARSAKFSPSALWRRWKRYSTKTLHSARHTNATLLYQATKNLRAVQKQLGHSRITTTQIYADVTPDVMRESMTAMETLTRALKRGSGKLPGPAETDSQ